MEYEKIKEIIKDMENSKLSSLSIEFSDGTKVSMTKQQGEMSLVGPRPNDIESKEIVKQVKEEIGEQRDRRSCKISNSRNFLCKIISRCRTFCYSRK